MKKWKKKGQQLLATCLCALLLLGIVPLRPFASDMQASGDAGENAADTPLQETLAEPQPAEILYEDTQKRDAYTKVYKKSDGSYTAMVSATPLHFQQDGAWVDIDNTLTAATQDGENVLINTDNPLEVALPETLSAENGVTLRENGNTITFSLVDAQASEAELSAQTLPVSEEAAVELKTQSETAVYTDVLPDTNLEYSISSNSVKENIIIEHPQAVRESYAFSVSAPGLTASCAQNGAVTFRSADGDTAFVVPAPFMRDAAGASSTEISVALSGENGTYTLVYTPSSVWLATEERQYPVVIDPAVTSDSDAWYETVCVRSDEPNEGYYNESLWAVANGRSYDDETGEVSSADLTYTMYIRLLTDKLQMLTKGVTPTEVQLVLQGAGMNLAAYAVTENCTYADMTYAGRPQYYASQPVDYYTGAGSASSMEYVHFNITKPFYEWLSGVTPNYGMAIYSYDDTLPAIGLFFGEAFSGGVLLLIDYVESTGYSESFDYHTQDVGRVGISYIQDFSQNLFIKRDDIAISGNLMPVQISFLYNPALLLNLRSTVAMENMEIPEVYGKGWLTNYNRFLYVDMIEMLLKGETAHISYAAENGNLIRFAVQENENGAFTFAQEEDTLADGGYALTYDPPESYTGDFSPEYLYLTTPSGYMERFDASGRLVEIYKEKYPEQSVDIAYVSSLETDMNLYAIDSITDGAGRMYDFIYDSNGMLTEIQCKTADGTAIKGGSSIAELDMEYEYDEAGNLTEVLFPDGGGAYYTYDTAGYLTSADSRHMYKLVYTYSADGRVTSVTEQAQDISTLSGFETGNSITITPNGPRQVTFSDLNGAKEIRQFDGSGRTVTVSDERGNFADMATGMVHTRTQNMLLNQSFEDGAVNWTINDASGVSIVSGEAYHGDKAAKIDANQTDSGSVMQSVTEPEAGTYTFSAYIKAQSGFTTAQSVAMLAVALDAEGNELKSNLRTVAATSEEYARYGLTLEVPENTASVQVGVGSIGRGGVFYVDAVQLEKGSGFGAYNFLANSGFYAQTDGVLEDWQSVGAYLLNDSTQRVPWGDPVIFSASKTADYALTQTVELDGKQGDILTFGGWIFADLVSNDSGSRLGTLYPDLTDFRGDRFAGFTISYEYATIEDGETVTKTETVRKAAQDFITDWQYVSESVQLLGDCTEVTFSFEYENHPASVIVAAPALTLETGFAAEEVDETQLPEETTSPESADEAAPAASEQTASAQGSEETQTQEDTNEPGCACEDCTMLGCTCTCESADVCECPQCQKLFDITYDEYGNLLSISIAGYDVGQLLRMSLSRTFSASGNYLKTSTNESGGTVTYAYNEDNGVLDSETDARGNITEYTYNAVGALTQVKTPVSGLAKEALILQPTAMITSYGYLNDRVTSITHNGYSYFIDYDRWSNVDRVYAGAADAITGGLLKTYVAEYTYGTGADHSRLAGITYGNGGTVHYRYDEYDRVTGISYDGGETYRFTYSYDTLGNLTLVMDSVENYIALYNETSVEIYRDGDLVYYVCADADGNLVEVVDGRFVYTTVEGDTTRDETTGTTAQKTTVSAEDAALELLTSSDAFGRKQQQTTLLRDLTDTAETPNFAAVTADYGYKTTAQGETTAATGQVDSIVSRVTYGTSMVDANNVARYGFAYDYDANGNITNEYAVAADGTRTLRYRYTYDEANQLTRVDDNTQGKTHVYQYDRGGNRVSEKIYAYTLGTVSGDPQQTVSSYYGPRVDSVEGLFRGWYDVLRTYDGKGIQYDRSGNPVSYDGKTFTWNGKQLTKVTAADGSYTEFSYDANGLRTQKRQYTADGTLEYNVDYVWQDGLLTHQNMTYYLRITIKNETRVAELPFSAKFVYDESNTPVGCLVNDEAAVGFVRNLQGDIIAAVTQEGDVLAEYSYDPWGKVTISSDGEEFEGMEAALMALYCPFAYRGYNYDYTTGLYYLQSRYYNPEWGRFLNVDDTNILLSTQGENLGANLFAYCENDPVNKVDYTGYWAEDSLPIAVVSMLHLVFTNKGKDLVLRDGFINIESGSKAWSGLYKISIDLKTDGALETIVSSLRRSEENTYRALTIFCMAVFETQIGRHFLFSDDCVQHEIEEHIKGFLASNDIKTFGRTPWYMTIFSTGEWLLGGKWFSTSISDYVLDHCKSVDIAEWDVYSFDDAITFGYFDGIRRCYHRTKADPYMNALNLRPDYQRFSPIPNDRTEWIRYLMSEGSV